MYKTVFDRMPIAAVYLDNDGKVVLWNRLAEKLLGYESEYIVGKNINIIIPERFKVRHNAGYAAAIKSGITKFVGGKPLKRNFRTNFIINLNKPNTVKEIY